jgi:predicted double-glycine peptidase
MSNKHRSAEAKTDSFQVPPGLDEVKVEQRKEELADAKEAAEKAGFAAQITPAGHLRVDY